MRPWLGVDVLKCCLREMSTHVNGRWVTGSEDPRWAQPLNLETSSVPTSYLPPHLYQPNFYHPPKVVAGTGRTHRTHGTGRTHEFLPLAKIDSDFFLLFQVDSSSWYRWALVKTSSVTKINAILPWLWRSPLNYDSKANTMSVHASLLSVTRSKCMTLYQTSKSPPNTSHNPSEVIAKVSG